MTDNLNFSLLNETLDQYMEAINLLDSNVIDGIIGEVVFGDSDDLDFGIILIIRFQWWSWI